MRNSFTINIRKFFFLSSSSKNQFRILTCLFDRSFCNEGLYWRFSPSIKQLIANLNLTGQQGELLGTFFSLMRVVSTILALVLVMVSLKIDENFPETIDDEIHSLSLHRLLNHN